MLQTLQTICVFCMIAFIESYQVIISPLLGPRCRFYPSCSQYAMQSYQQFGFFKGSVLTLKRLLKCHPFHPGGIDECPEPK